ncbi:unnamed protein product [Mytilus edulis]|uniref:Uncharacterized protein n=1 Tax=Mytilus edulis TaxID=6550 RepID=A0A8S3VIS8_MYTED|nr:unnamed protein product [Mytilus edulis]
MAITGNKTSKSKRRSSKTADIEMKLFSLEESFDKRFDKYFGLLQTANKSADSSHTGKINTIGNNFNKVDRLANIFKDDLPGDNSDESVVPSLDDMLEPMIKRVHTNKTVKSWDKQKQLFSQPVKQIEKLAYSGQVASRMGIISISYMQQALGTLLGYLENDNASEENCQLVKDFFAMSTKSLDQVGRAGAFHHMIRRKCAATDAGINNLNDIQAKVLYLPLSDDGVFGQGLEKQLEKRKEQREQLEDLLPEFHKNNKRKLDYDSCDSCSNKQTKFTGNSTYNNYNNNYKKPSFNTNRQSSLNSSHKSLQRGGFGNKGKKDKDTKTSNSGTGSWGSFRIPKKLSI